MSTEIVYEKKLTLLLPSVEFNRLMQILTERQGFRTGTIKKEIYNEDDLLVTKWLYITAISIFLGSIIWLTCSFYKLLDTESFYWRLVQGLLISSLSVFLIKAKFHLFYLLGAPWTPGYHDDNKLKFIQIMIHITMIVGSTTTLIASVFIMLDFLLREPTALI